MECDNRDDRVWQDPLCRRLAAFPDLPTSISLTCESLPAPAHPLLPTGLLPTSVLLLRPVLEPLGWERVGPPGSLVRLHLAVRQGCTWAIQYFKPALRLLGRHLSLENLHLSP